MQILTSAEMQSTDQRTAEEFHIPLTTLMENAGTAVARFCLRRFGHAQRILVLCGKGNNGGDGLVAARILASSGRSVEVLLLGREDEVRGDAAHALHRLHDAAHAVGIASILGPADLSHQMDALSSADLMIDAVLGTGFKPPLRETAAALRDLLARVATPVVAVDLPSGWDADSSAQTSDTAFRADAVVTFTRPKLAHIFGHLTAATFGAVAVADIGSPAASIVSETNLHWTSSSKSLSETPRPINSNKGMYGHVLLIGGSYGTSGAPSMSSLAALRAGAGLVTAAVPRSMLSTVAAVAPELMTAPLGEGPEGAVSLASTSAIDDIINQKRISTIAIGPGLSTRGDGVAFARAIVTQTKLPIVVDADALNAFDGRADLLNGAGRTLVLTPHPGEMARLAGMSVKDVESDRIGLARRFATEHQLTLVLKGWRTLIAHPDGRIAVNTSGNPSMAKGGSGDILTGIVAAMLAQFPHDIPRAVEAAVYLHGLAGDFAAHAMDEHTVLATDTLAHLSDAFRYRTTDADGLTWICGLHHRT